MGQRGGSDGRGAYNGDPLVSRRYLHSILGYSYADLRRIAEDVGVFYRPFELKARRGDGSLKVRRIDRPVGVLADVQKAIYRRIVCELPLPDWILGGVIGKGIRDNGKLHVRRAEVVTLDVREFFPSIRPGQVCAAIRHHTRASPSIAELLTRLCTYEDRLPQGASTSTAIGNLVLYNVLRGEQERLAREGLVLSTWVDDVVLSGRGARRAMGDVIGALHGAGFRVARDKVRVMPAHVPQVVTGTLVNSCVSNGPERRGKLRALVHHTTHGEPELIDRARGMLAFAGWIRPSQVRAATRALRLHSGDR